MEEFGKQLKISLSKKQIKDKEEIIKEFVKKERDEYKGIIEFIEKVAIHKLNGKRTIEWYNLWKNFELTKEEIIGLEKSKKYDYEETIEQLVNNPYIILKLSLHKCDIIANKYGLKLGEERARSVFIRKLREYIRNNGWTYIPSIILKQNEEYWKKNKSILKDEYELIEVENGIYFKKQYEQEQNIINLLKQIKCYIDKKELEEILDICKENFNFLTEEQKSALELGCKNPCSIITGGAGCGKTTIIKCFIEIFTKLKIPFVILSFTGKAVSRIKEITKCKNIYTIHKFLCSYNKIIEEILTPKIVIFDEASMIPLGLMGWFSKICNIPLQLIFMGDPNQLPPIKCGQIFHDLIISCKYPHICLTKSHRFSSSIYDNSNKILFGKEIQKSNDVELYNITEDEYMNKITDIINNNNLHDKSFNFTILCGYNPQLKELNLLCQSLCNPYGSEKKIKVFGQDVIWKVGDRVMMLENNYFWNIMNGEEGSVIALYSDKLQVEFSEHRIVDFLYSIPDLSLSRDDRSKSSLLYISYIRHSWAMTIHKSQGSEWSIVIIPLPSYMRSDFYTRKLIYTAFTRSRNKCIILGDISRLHNLLKSPITGRHSNLSNLL